MLLLLRLTAQVTRRGQKFLGHANAFLHIASKHAAVRMLFWYAAVPSASASKRAAVLPLHLQDLIDVGWTSVWVKVVTQWCVAGLYIWTMVAPYVFPDRDF